MIIVLNNKSNFTIEEYNDYLTKLENINTNHKIILCPAPIYLLKEIPHNIYLGSQNVSKYPTGSHTGEISAEQLKSIGVEYCIIGHSERIQEQKESLQDINQKLKEVLNSNIIPILCLGETLSVKSKNKTKEVLMNRLYKMLLGINKEDRDKIIIAYEPVWGIGTGSHPSNIEINKCVQYIKEELPNNKVLYGGSLDENNINELDKYLIVDGYLLGKLSILPEKLEEFLKTISSKE